MRLLGVIAAIACIGGNSAMAADPDWRVGGQFGFELATGLGYDHDNLNVTEPLRVQDYRYTLETSAGVGLQTQNYNFDLHYKFDQRSYEEYNVLHRERQQVTATADTTLLPGTDFSLRYRFRRSQPEGQLGTIDYNQLRGRLRLPSLATGALDLSVRPYLMADWNSGDFKKRDGLDGTGWSGTSGFLISRADRPWESDISIAYGERVAQFFFFTYDYVDTSASFQTILGSWARWIAMSSATADFEISYREEWYDGGMADDGSHRHDQEFGASFDINRPITEQLDFVGTFEIDEHQSNWGAQDFLETRTMVGFRAEF